MATKDTTCPKCSAAMRPGFVLDWKQGMARTIGEWVEGEYESTLFDNVRLEGHARWPLRGVRCESCGFVELYAWASRREP